MAEKTHSEGWITFATILAALAGITNLLFGISMMLSANAFPNAGVLFTTLSLWGLGMVVLGALEIVAALWLIARKNAGRIFAIVIASISLVGWMMWRGVFPFAALSALVLDILVIYGLSVTREYFD